MISNAGHEFELLVEEAKKYVLEYPSAEQVIVVKTAKSNIRFLANNVLDEKYEDEKRFVQKLIDEEDVVIQQIVCMWNDASVDLPSMNFRKLLLKVSEENKNARMYLGKRIMEIYKSMP